MAIEFGNHCERWLRWNNSMTRGLIRNWRNNETVQPGADYRMVVIVILDESSNYSLEGYRNEDQSIRMRSGTGSAYFPEETLPFEGTRSTIPGEIWVGGGLKAVTVDGTIVLQKEHSIRISTTTSDGEIWTMSSLLPDPATGLYPAVGYTEVLIATTAITTLLHSSPRDFEFEWSDPDAHVGELVPVFEHISDCDWTQTGNVYRCKYCDDLVTSSTIPRPRNCPAAPKDNEGARFWEQDWSEWEAFLATICPNQNCRLGVLQVENPGPPEYQTQKYGVGAWDSHLHAHGDIRDITPDYSWGRKQDGNYPHGTSLKPLINEAFDKMPRDTDRSTVDHKILPWPGTGSDGVPLGPRVTSDDIIDFYNEITNNDAFNPDIFSIFTDISPSLRPNYTYINTLPYPEYNEVPYLPFQGDPGRWPTNEARSVARCHLTKLSPPGGRTPYGYSHHLSDGGQIADGRWLRMASLAVANWMSDGNDGCCRPFANRFHVLGNAYSSVDDQQYWAIQQTQCPGVVGPTQVK